MMIYIVIVDSLFVGNTFLRWMHNDSRLSITPSANRNSFRVAIIVVQLPRVADYARYPKLGKRHSYRVAAADKPRNKRDQQRTPPQYSQRAYNYNPHRRHHVHRGHDVGDAYIY